MVNLDDVRRYVVAHGLHEEGQFIVKELNGLVHIAPSTPLKGGPGYYVVTAAGDIIDKSVFGSGVGYHVVMYYVKRSGSDPEVNALLNEKNLVDGNVMTNEYYRSNPDWALAHQPDEAWLEEQLSQRDTLFTRSEP